MAQNGMKTSEEVSEFERLSPGVRRDNSGRLWFFDPGTRWWEYRLGDRFIDPHWHTHAPYDYEDGSDQEINLIPNSSQPPAIQAWLDRISDILK